MSHPSRARSVSRGIGSTTALYDRKNRLPVDSSVTTSRLKPAPVPRRGVEEHTGEISESKINHYQNAGNPTAQVQEVPTFRSHNSSRGLGVDGAPRAHPTWSSLTLLLILASDEFD